MNRSFNTGLFLTCVILLSLTVIYDVRFPLYFFMIFIVTFFTVYFRFVKSLFIVNRLKKIIVESGDEEKYKPYRLTQFNHYAFFSKIDYPDNLEWNKKRGLYFKIVDINKSLVIFCVFNFLSFLLFMLIGN